MLLVFSAVDFTNIFDILWLLGTLTCTKEKKTGDAIALRRFLCDEAATYTYSISNSHMLL